MNTAFEQSSAQELVERILESEGAGAVSTAEWVQVAARVQHKLMVALAPVLGDVGGHVLMARSVKKAKVRFPAMAGVVTGGSWDVLREQLCACLAGQEPAEVRSFLGVALAALFQLLSTFIGEALTRRLLKEQWPQMIIDRVPDSVETS